MESKKEIKDHHNSIKFTVTDLQAQTVTKGLSARIIRYNCVVFLVWTGTSFLCHFCAKVFLTSSASFSHSQGVTGPLLFVGLLTFVQTATCYLGVDVNCRAGDSWLRTARVTHVLATFATNLSLAVMFASSTLAIKLLEPITSALTVYCVQGTPLSAVTIMSLPIIVGGAVTFSGNPFLETQFSIGVCSAFVSNILLAFRTLLAWLVPSLGYFNIERFQIPVITCCMLIGWLSLLVLESSGFLKVGVSYMAAMCLLSGVFHVAYSYVSTGLVLTELSVVGHAVANIMKRVLVVLLLYMFGKRTAGPYNFLGLGACTLGLLLYVWDKQRKRSTGQENDPGTPFKCRMFHWRYMLIALGSLFVVVVAFQVPEITVPLKGWELTSYSRSNVFTVNSVAREEMLVPTTKPLIDLNFGGNWLKQPEQGQLDPDLSDYLSQNKDGIEAFLKQRLIKNSRESGYLSTQLKTSLEVIKEAQRIHFNMFQDAFGKYKYCILFDIADFENKGDPAITVGEVLFINRMGIEIVYYCATLTCINNKVMNMVVLKAQNYSTDELVVLLHGGGNINGYKMHDILRFKIFEMLKSYQFVMLPQSIWVTNTSSSHFQLISSIYCCNENLTMVLRDKLSYQIAQQYFKGSSRLLMAPDSAFHIGSVKRFVPPVFDILWLKRDDSEKPVYSKFPSYPSHLRVHVSDWQKFRTPLTNISLERATYAAVMGLFFIQRARVVVTDRLHGHILATLSDIPHVLLDNTAKKLSSYHNTWTSGVENTRLTNNTEQAMKLALELLDIYGKAIPPLTPWLNVSEQLKDISYKTPDTSYP